MKDLKCLKCDNEARYFSKAGFMCGICSIGNNDHLISSVDFGTISELYPYYDMAKTVGTEEWKRFMRVFNTKKDLILTFKSMVSFVFNDPDRTKEQIRSELMTFIQDLDV